MALPNSGALSAEQINIEIKRASQALMSLNDADVRTLGQKPSGEISYSDLRGKSFIALDGGDLTWTDNTYTYVAFTSPGTLQVNQPVSVTYIVVGGGGGAGASGGGAGGYLLGSALLSVGSMPVTVGAGGVGYTPNSQATSGGNSVFNGETGLGGGKDATPGGCGGGAGENQRRGEGQQGFPGGGRSSGPQGGSFGSSTAGGGGGGMTRKGQTGYERDPFGAQDGGDGGQGILLQFPLPTPLNPVPNWAGGPQYICGGGGGRGVARPPNRQYSASGGRAGQGGGGQGTPSNAKPALQPYQNASGIGGGGGGGRTSQFDLGSGGSGRHGIVVVRYIPPN